MCAELPCGPSTKDRKIPADAGGEGGIRTHGGREPTAVFKTAALNHSATSPIGCRRACRGTSAVFQVMPGHFALIARVHHCRDRLCTGRDEPSWRAKGFAP